MEERNMGEESWYLSGKSEEGRIRYVWRAQVGKGARMDVEGKVRRRVGWRPVGSEKAVKYDVPESCGEGWCREGKENRVGSGHDSVKVKEKISRKKEKPTAYLAWCFRQSWSESRRTRTLLAQRLFGWRGHQFRFCQNILNFGISRSMSLEMEVRVGMLTRLAIEIWRHNLCLDNQLH